MPDPAPSPAWEPGHPILLAGSTAVGKSEVAMALAELVDGEIISVDSMQVYRGMDIGTAKPSPADQRRVRHHLIDVADISEPFDAAAFCRGAEAALAEIRGRGRTPIFCGGTGLYYKAWLEGLGTAPPRDLQLRANLQATGLGELLEELRRSDPVTYERIDRQNPRRVIRAVEVIRLTGKPFSEQRSDWGSASQEGKSRFPFFFLRRPVELLWERIHRRVDAMMEAGWLEETRQLVARGLEKNPNALQAIGYRDLIAHLRDGVPLGETVERIKIHTRQFARRQRIWFQGQSDALPVDLDSGETVTSVAARVRALLK